MTQMFDFRSFAHTRFAVRWEELALCLALVVGWFARHGNVLIERDTLSGAIVANGEGLSSAFVTQKLGYEMDKKFLKYFYERRPIR